MPDGMTAVGAGVLQHVADPVLSALRATLVSGGNTYQSLQLLNAVNASGAGGTFTAFYNGGGYGAGFYYMTVSGNSATAEFAGSIDGTNWLRITAIANGAGTTGTGQWSGYYPYLRGGVVWASAGGGLTGTVTLKLALL